MGRGNYRGVRTEKFAATDKIAGNAVEFIETASSAAINPANQGLYVSVQFSASIKREGFSITEYGILYSNNGTITDSSALTLSAVDSNNVKQMKGNSSGNLRDFGTGVVAVGYAKVKNSADQEAIIYTSNIGGKYSNLN